MTLVLVGAGSGRCKFMKVAVITARQARAPTLTTRVVVVEEQVATMTMTAAEMDAQLRTLLATVTKTAEAAQAAHAVAMQNTTSCQELRVTTEQILKSQDNVSNKVSHLETQIEGLGTRISSLEGTIAATAGRTPGPHGRRQDSDPQGIAHERVLANGVFHTARNQHESGPSVEHFASHYDAYMPRPDSHVREHHHDFRMPKTSFPKFDGTHPKIWKEKAEKYFHMFHVPEEYKVDYATLHFIGTAAQWL